MTKSTQVAGLVLALALSFMPVIAFAQSTGTGVPSQIVTCNGPDCTFCSLVDLAQNILNFAIYLAVIGAALLFAWAGALYLTSAENPGQRTKAKKLFMSVAIGFVIMFSAWFLVDTLMRDLTDGRFTDWYRQLCNS